MCLRIIIIWEVWFRLLYVDRFSLLDGGRVKQMIQNKARKRALFFCEQEFKKVRCLMGKVKNEFSGTPMWTC